MIGNSNLERVWQQYIVKHVIIVNFEVYNMKAFLTGVIIMIGFAANAQTGVITIKDNAGVKELIEKHIYFNKEHGELPGYRIQVLATTSLTTAKETKASFLQLYEDYKVSIVFEAPNYKVRIGNYVNRFDANRELQELILVYPSAFIVKDLINITEE